MNQPSACDFRLGPFEIRPDRNRIAGPEGESAVEPKAMAVLLELLSAEGRTVPREQLVRAVWPRGFVTDDVLNRCIGQLRQALGDDARSPRFIATVPKVGYRLVEPAVPCGDAGRAPGVSPKAPPAGIAPPGLPVESVPLPHALAVSSPPFTGRAAELGTILEAWRAAQQGGLRVLLVSGEPGMGKSRLAGQLAAKVRSEGKVVLYGACSEFQDLAYEPFIEALRHLAAHAGPRELAGALGAYPEELTRLLPDLGRYVPDLPPPLQSDPETQRHRLFAAVESWIRGLAAGRGLLFVIDDLHWTDTTTLSLLRYLFAQLSSAPVLALATYRDTDVPRTRPLADALGALLCQPAVSQLKLQALKTEEIAELMSAVVSADAGGWIGDFADRVQRETEGNPFFVVELVRHLAESGHLRRDGSGRWTTDIEEHGKLPVPQNVREVINRRLGHLSERANAVLCTAAVVGQHFALDTIAPLAGGGEDAVLDGLDEALRARLVEEVGVGRYGFTHALIRSSLFENLSATRRARCHRAIAELFRKRGAPAADLAFHYGHAASIGADVASVAADFTLAAGREANKNLAPDQATDYFQQALALLDGLEEGETPRRTAALIGLGVAERNAGNPAYRKTLLDAASMAERVGDATLIGEVALANQRFLWSAIGKVDRERVAALLSALRAFPETESPVRARLLAQLAIEMVFAPEARDIPAFIAEAEAIARRIGDAECLAEVLAAKIIAAWTADTGPEMHQVGEELVERREALPDPVRRVQAYAWCSVHLRTVGLTERARAATQKISAIAEEYGALYALRVARLIQAVQAATEGDIREAERRTAQWFDIFQRTGQPDVSNWYTALTWSIRLQQGRVHEPADDLGLAVRQTGETAAHLPFYRALDALSLLFHGQRDYARAAFETLADTIHELPKDFTWLPGLYVLALLARPLRDQSRAERLYRLALPYAGQAVNMGFAVFNSTDHVLGLTAAVAGRLDDADRHFADAAAFEERAGMRGWLMFTHLEWARALLERGHTEDADRARMLFKHACATAEEIGNTKLLAEARELQTGC